MIMKIRSRDEFKKAFLHLLKTKPISRITVSEIIRTSGYSRSSFYRNYVDYYDFIEKTVREEAEILALQLSNLLKDYNVEKGLNEALLCGVMEHVYREKDLYHMIFNAQSFIPSVTAMNFSLLVMNCFRDAGTFKFDSGAGNVDEEFYRYSETLRFVRYLLYWDANNYSFSPSYMAKQIVEMDHLDKAFAVLKP